MSFFSPDQDRLRARIRILSCPRCQRSFVGAEIQFRRTRIDVYCPCGQMTSFTAPALRYDLRLVDE